MNPKVDAFFNKDDKWREAFQALRAIALDCQLTEELKWGSPCYTFQKGNVVLMHGFKEYCAFMFFKGALLKDEQDILIAATENVQAARQIRFTSARQIVEMAPTLRAYLLEAMELEKAGLKFAFKKTAEFDVPVEFQNKLDEDPALKAAFVALTPGRQRGYLLHFSAPKQSTTRESRIEKCTPMILDGKGLDDR